MELILSIGYVIIIYIFIMWLLKKWNDEPVK